MKNPKIPLPVAAVVVMLVVVFSWLSFPWAQDMRRPNELRNKVHIFFEYRVPRWLGIKPAAPPMRRSPPPIPANLITDPGMRESLRQMGLLGPNDPNQETGRQEATPQRIPASVDE